MLLNSRVGSFVLALSLLLGLATTVSAADTAKSWEVDLYRDRVDLTYVDDGRDDVDVYDHSYNSYDNYENYSEYDYDYDAVGYDEYYDNYSYSPSYSRSRYYDDYRGW